MVSGELKTLRITLEAVDDDVLGYVYLRDIASGQSQATRQVQQGVNADYDGDGQLLGVEFLHAEQANADVMRTVAAQLDAPELAGIDLAVMCNRRNA